MTWTPAAAASHTSPQDDLSEARRQVETYCQALVDTGEAQWWINEAGRTELHLDSGEAYLFGEQGVTRVK
ncbi:MAG: hypothetical protein JSS14_01850 [Proteobacteria bacterium]|nr:hypothetical protein [Pseudomonadota bacterium]